MCQQLSGHSQNPTIVGLCWLTIALTCLIAQNISPIYAITTDAVVIYSATIATQGSESGDCMLVIAIRTIGRPNCRMPEAERPTIPHDH